MKASEAAPLVFLDRSTRASLLALLVAAGCKGDPAGPTTASSVAVLLASNSVVIGQTTQATASVKGPAGESLSGRMVTWSSSDQIVATVSSVGLVTTAALGTATITATVDGKSGSALLTVAPVPVASVTVTPAIDTLTVGRTAQLSAVARDQAGNILENRPAVWTTSAQGSATVSQDGLMTAIGPGAVQVTATVGEVSGSIAVSVQALLPLTPVGVEPAIPGQVVRLSAGAATLPSGPFDGFLGTRRLKFGRVDGATLAALVPSDAPPGQTAVKVQLGPFLVGATSVVVGSAAIIENPTQFVDSLLTGLRLAIPSIPPAGTNADAFSGAASAARARVDSARVLFQLLSNQDRSAVAHLFAAVPLRPAPVSRPSSALASTACETARARLTSLTRLTVETLVLMVGVLVAAAVAALLTGGFGAPAFVFTLRVVGASSSLAVVLWVSSYILAVHECGVVQGLEAQISGIGASAGQDLGAPTVGTLAVGGEVLVTLVATERGLKATDIGTAPAATELDAAYKSVANALGPFAAYTSIPGLDAVTPISQVTATTVTTSTVNPADASWTSSNAAVALVTNGAVRGVASGQATITGVYQGQSAAVTLTVTGFGSIVGTVSSSQRGPLGGVKVSTQGASAATGSTGQYQLHGNVPEGPATVRLGTLPAGCADPGPQSVEVPPGGTALVNFTVTCTPTVGTVSGVVTSPQRGGLSGVTVSVGGGGTAQTNASGGYTFLNSVPVGDQVVALFSLPSGCTDPGRRRLSVTANGTATVNFTVTCNVTIAGTIRSSQGGPLAGVTLSIGASSATTNAAGVYSLTATPPGPPTVVFGNLPAGCTNPGARTVQVPQGGTAILDLTAQCTAQAGTVTGSVTSPQQGLTGVTVTAGSKSAATDASSIYKILGVPAGPTTVTVSGLPTGCTDPGSKTAAVPPGGTANVSFVVTCSVGTLTLPFQSFVPGRLVVNNLTQAVILGTVTKADGSVVRPSGICYDISDITIIAFAASGTSSKTTSCLQWDMPIRGLRQGSVTITGRWQGQTVTTSATADFTPPTVTTTASMSTIAFPSRDPSSQPPPPVTISITVTQSGSNGFGQTFPVSSHQPTSCAGSPGRTTCTYSVSYFDEDFIVTGEGYDALSNHGRSAPLTIRIVHQ